MCPQEEVTGERPSNYSKWHRRALPSWCSVTDGDWFEQRTKDGKFKAVAYIETIQVPVVHGADKAYPPWPSKANLCQEIKDEMGIPVYIVWHNAGCDDFLVLKLGEAKPKRMNGQEYAEFIKGL
jgi:hypothetical protein